MTYTLLKSVVHKTSVSFGFCKKPKLQLLHFQEVTKIVKILQFIDYQEVTKIYRTIGNSMLFKIK